MNKQAIGKLININIEKFNAYTDEQMKLFSNAHNDIETKYKNEAYKFKRQSEYHKKNKTNKYFEDFNFYVPFERESSYYVEENKYKQHYQLKYVFETMRYKQKYNTLIPIVEETETGVIIKISSDYFVLPKDVCTYELYENLDNLTPLEITQKLLPADTANDTSAALATMSNELSTMKSKVEVRASLEAKQEEINLQQQKAKEEIDELKRKFDLEKQKLEKELNAKMDELLKTKKALEKDIFNIDRYLYNVKCLLGDTFELVQLRKGKKASDKEPIYVYQKLRYIDEDLAKLDSVNKITMESYEFAEDILAKNDFAFNQFIPTQKGIVILKASQDEHEYVRDEYGILDRMLNTNGKRIAILIRNGENLWIIWTEEDRIYLKENFIYKNVEKALDDSTRIDEDETITDDNYMKSMAWHQYFSREFIFNILKGLVQYKNLFTLPEDEDFASPSNNIIYTTMDNALIDTRYGTFTDYDVWSKKMCKVGDWLLPVESLSGEEYSSFDKRYHHKSKGEYNRTHDVHIPKEPIQLSEFIWNSSNDLCCIDDLYLRDTKHKQHTVTTEQGNIYSLRDIHTQLCEMAKEQLGEEYKTTEIHTLQIVKDNLTFELKYERNYKTQKDELREDVLRVMNPRSYREFYVKGIKNGWKPYAREITRASTRIESNEFFVLNYLTSDMLRYYIETKQIGGNFRSYAYMVPLLKKALVFLETQENNNLIEISKFYRNVDKIKDINIIVLMWKLYNKVTNITSFQAKRFATYLKSIKDSDKEAKRCLKELPWIKEK